MLCSPHTQVPPLSKEIFLGKVTLNLFGLLIKSVEAPTEFLVLLGKITKKLLLII
jgi:hypothetical protein